MSGKMNVIVNMVSRCTTAPGESGTWTVRAAMYSRAGATWYRFRDPTEEMGETTTTVKVRQGHIAVVRHGVIRSDQTFVERRETTGYYQFPGGRLALSMRTHFIDVRLDDGVGVVTWSYDLLADGQLTGTYELKLDIQEDET